MTHMAEDGAAADSPPRPLLLYDADCGLCDAVARRLLRAHARRGTALYFAPLQGSTARGLLRESGLLRACDEANKVRLDSIVYFPGGAEEANDIKAFLLRSDAIIALLRATGGGGWGALAAALRAVPRGARDALYVCVAKMRRRIFGGVGRGAGVADDPRWAAWRLP